MIEVAIGMESDTDETPIARLRIHNTSGLVNGEEDIATYVAEFIIDEGDELVFISRTFSFNRKHYSALALVQQALETLTEEELKFHGKASGSGHLAWGQSGIDAKTESQFSELRHNRPALWDGLTKWSSKNRGR